MTPETIETTLTPEETAKAEALQRQLVQTAIECFARFGVHRTRMEDVAKAANTSRATFYRYYSGRNELVDAVVTKQLADIIDEHGPGIWRAKRLDTALVEGSVKVLLACHGNAVFMELLNRARHERLSELSLGDSAFGEPLARLLWKPVLETTRESRELRQDLTDDEIVRWISSVHFLLLMRDDLTAGDIRAVMGKFVVPGLVETGRP